MLTCIVAGLPLAQVEEDGRGTGEIVGVESQGLQILGEVGKAGRDGPCQVVVGQQQLLEAAHGRAHPRQNKAHIVGSSRRRLIDNKARK